MRYIMILSLCLVGFEGYAASTADAMDGEAPSGPIFAAGFPTPMDCDLFARILETDSVTDGKNTWKIVSLCKQITSDGQDVFLTYIQDDKGLPETAILITKQDAIDWLTQSQGYGVYIKHFQILGTHGVQDFSARGWVCVACERRVHIGKLVPAFFVLFMPVPHESTH